MEACISFFDKRMTKRLHECNRRLIHLEGHGEKQSHLRRQKDANANHTSPPLLLLKRP